MGSAKPIARRELWFLGSILLLFCLLAATLALPAEEDAFIYYRYAWNFAHGHGLVFNTGDPVEGFSGPLWMGILALVAKAGLDLPRAATILGLLCGVAALAATWALGRAAGLGRSARLLATACVALSYPFIVWSRSGLETPLYALAIAVAAAAYLAAEYPLDPEADRRQRRWPRRIAAVTPVFVCLGRPEGAMLVVAMVLDRLTAPREAGRDWAGALRYGAPAALGYGGYLVWRFLTFHSLVPNTSVKLYPLLIERSGGQFLDYLLLLGFLPLFLPLVPLLNRHRTPAERRRLGFLVAVVCLVSFLFNFLAGGDYRPGFRYFIPTLPVLIVAVWYAADLLRPLSSRPARALLAMLLLSGSLIQLAKNPPRLHDWRREVYEKWRDPSTDAGNWGIKIARWMEETVPEHSVVAFGQMGRIPYYLARDGHEVRFVDTLGLVDRQVSGIYRFDGKIRDFLREVRAGRSPREALEIGRRRRAERLAETVLGKHPDFLLIEAALNDYPMMRALQENPELQTAYRQSGQLPLAGLPYVRIYTPIHRRP
jgi:arabinofuranosyltransferase